MFSRTSLLGSARRCVTGLGCSRSHLHPPQLIQAKQNARPCCRSNFLRRNHGETKYAPSPPPTPTSLKAGFVKWYLGMIEARPVATKAITTGIIFTAADICAQQWKMYSLKLPDSYDPIRTLRMGGYGLIIGGPSLHYWFNFVSVIFPKNDVPSILKKMLMGQTMCGPVMNSIFFSVNAALQGETFDEIIARLKRDLVPTTLRGLMYWPVCDFIMFRFAPVRLMPLVNNCFAFVWTIYITHMAGLEKAGLDSSAI